MNMNCENPIKMNKTKETGLGNKENNEKIELKIIDILSNLNIYNCKDSIYCNNCNNCNNKDEKIKKLEKELSKYCEYCDYCNIWVSKEKIKEHYNSKECTDNYEEMYI